MIPLEASKVGVIRQGRQRFKRKTPLVRLIELWKGADPELQPRVEAARRRMETLTQPSR